MSDQLEQQIERAWLRHQPERDRIPTSVRRELAAIKRELEPTAIKIKVALTTRPGSKPWSVNASGAWHRAAAVACRRPS